MLMSNAPAWWIEGLAKHGDLNLTELEESRSLILANPLRQPRFDTLEKEKLP